MKKVIATIVALCLALSMCVCASAADTASIEATSAGYVAAGAARIDVPIVLKNASALAASADNLSGIELNITFDDTQVSLVSTAVKATTTLGFNYEGEDEDGNPAQVLQKYDLDFGLTGDSTTKAKLMLSNPKMDLGTVALDGDITLATLRFAVKDGVADGTVIKATIEMVDACDSNSHKFADQITVGEVEIATVGTAPASSEASSTPSEDSSTPSEDSSIVSGTSSATSGASKVSTPSTASTASKAASTASKATTTTNPKTGDTGVLAVGALMVVAAGAAFVTMKKR